MVVVGVGVVVAVAVVVAVGVVVGVAVAVAVVGLMTRYRVVRDLDGAPHPHPAQPAEGFGSATEASLWHVTNDLDGRWYIQPMPEVCRTCRGSGVVWEHHGPGLTEWLACDECSPMPGDVP